MIKILFSFWIHHIFGTEKYYKNVEFQKDDHFRLYNSIKNIKGKFLLTYNDCEYIRELYKEFNIIAVERFSNLTTVLEKGETYKEIIIKNF